MEYAQLQSFAFVFLSLCGGIAAASGACAAVVRFWKYAHKQSEDNADTLGEHEMWLTSDKRRIERLESKQDEAEAQNKLMLKALVTLMSHELDGNHTRQLVEVRDEIQDYLIQK